MKADLLAVLGETAARIAEQRAAERERLVVAWVAETGLLPSECCLVEEMRLVDGEIRSVVYVRRLSDVRPLQGLAE